MMKAKRLSKILIVILVACLLLSDVAALMPVGGVETAQAGTPITNAILGLFRTIGALRRRNRVYREAGATSEEINAYYDTLISQAGETRREMISMVAAGEQKRTVLARSYIRIEAALEAERRAAIAMIEVEKNQARKDFERALVKEIVNILVASPGGQRIIHQVRDTIGGAREAAVAVQAAIEGGKPIEALQEAFVKQVGDFPLAQAAARQLGSVVGHGVDKLLGGALTKIENNMEEMLGGLGEGIDVLDTLDSEVAKHDERERQPTSTVEENSLIGKIVPVNRVNPVLDVVASAWAGGAKIAGALEPGDTRDAMRDRVRGALLDDRVQGIQAAKSGTAAGSQYCTNVGRGPYEVAARQLGQTPKMPADPDSTLYTSPLYMVCYDIQSQVPVLAKMYGGGKKEDGELAEGEDPAAPPADQGEQVPVGTYVGTTDYIQFLDLFFYEGGSINTNQVNIQVAEDGTVSGSLALFYTSGTMIDERLNCTDIWEATINGTFSGQLTGSNGSIDYIEHWACKTIGTCSTEGECSNEPAIQKIDVQVIGDQMTGTTRPYPEDPDGIFIWTLNAKKE